MEMAITAKLQFGDNSVEMYSREYLVVDWRGHFVTPCNNIRPNGATVCQSFEIVLVAPDKSDLSLYEWFISGDAMSGRLLLDYSGTIHDANSSTQQVVFEDAACYALSEQYNIDDHTRRLLRLKVAPSSISISDICIG